MEITREQLEQLARIYNTLMNISTKGEDTFIMAVRNVGLRFVSAGHGQNLLEKRQTDVHWRTEKGRGTRTLDLLSQ